MTMLPTQPELGLPQRTTLPDRYRPVEPGEAPAVGGDPPPVAAQADVRAAVTVEADVVGQLALDTAGGHLTM
jgi:hypothetical protein